jgi:hypothetical protein
MPFSGWLCAPAGNPLRAFMRSNELGCRALWSGIGQESALTAASGSSWVSLGAITEAQVLRALP